MIKNKVLNSIQRIVAFPDYIKQHYSDKNLPETVFFYTFHKCASSLFASYILKNIKALQHVDYEKQIYTGRMAANKKPTFRKRGFVYGPIRLSANPKSSVYKMLIKPTTADGFMQNKIALFFVRDPRDILVSAYYSFGYTHGFSRVKEIRERQESTRNAILTNSLDDYVLKYANIQSKNFKTLYELANVCERSVILKYEDMVDNFEYFTNQLCKYIEIDENVIQEIYKKSRPKKKEDAFSHHRSGKAGGFRSKLKEKTIKSLNSNLENTLTLFDYKA